MSEVAFEKSVEDSVPRINKEVAVGEDLAFQRRWWRFETTMWWVIAALLLLNLGGVFGRGPISHARLSNEAMVLKYDRVERTCTPSMFVVQLQPKVLSKGQFKLHVSQSLVEELGAQRVIPSPVDTAVGSGGLTYTFSSETGPGSIEFALQPARPGIFRLSLQVAGYPALSTRVVVVP